MLLKYELKYECETRYKPLILTGHKTHTNLKIKCKQNCKTSTVNVVRQLALFSWSRIIGNNVTMVVNAYLFEFGQSILLCANDSIFQSFFPVTFIWYHLAFIWSNLIIHKLRLHLCLSYWSATNIGANTVTNTNINLGLKFCARTWL